MAPSCSRWGLDWPSVKFLHGKHCQALEQNAQGSESPCQKVFKNVELWHLETWPSDELGSAGLTVRPNDLKSFPTWTVCWFLCWWAPTYFKQVLLSISCWVWKSFKETKRQRRQMKLLKWFSWILLEKPYHYCHMGSPRQITSADFSYAFLKEYKISKRA